MIRLIDLYVRSRSTMILVDFFLYLQNWIAHGYNTWNRDKDTFEKHALLFSGVTMGIMATMFVIWYLPDVG